MFTRKSVGIAIASLSLAAVAATGFAVTANADTTSPSPTASATAQRGPNTAAPGTGVCDGTGMRYGGMGNGAGYGATWMVDYLAEKLGVSADKVSEALQAYRTANPTTTRGVDLTEAQQDARHDSLATFLADKLGVSKDKVLSALDSMQTDRQTENRAQPGGHGPRGPRA